MEKQAGWKQRKTKHIDKICKNFKVKTLLFNLQTKFSVSSLPCSKRAFNLVFSSVALIGDKITITEPKWVKVWAKHSVERVKLKCNSYSRCARPRVTSFFFLSQDLRLVKGADLSDVELLNKNLPKQPNAQKWKGDGKLVPVRLSYAQVLGQIIVNTYTLSSVLSFSISSLSFSWRFRKAFIVDFSSASWICGKSHTWQLLKVTSEAFFSSAM